MITVNPRVDTLDKDLIEAYRKILAPSLGHFIETGMSPDIKALWKPVKLVGPALTVQTEPDVTGALAKAVEIAQPGDVLVMSRGGEHTHATTGDFAVLRFQEMGIAGLITDGMVTDQRAIERLNFPVFSRGVSSVLVKARPGAEEGAVNVPVEVGGITVSPGDLILADEDGVMVASPQVARDTLATCQELEEWEHYALGQLDKGRSFLEVMQERRTYNAG